LKISVFENKEELSTEAARFISSKILPNDSFNLGVATGRTPISIYEILAGALSAANPADLRLVVVGLDEYWPITEGDPDSFHSYLMRHLINPNISIIEKFIYLNGSALDWKSECERFEEQLGVIGGVDLQIVGIGRNGHIGFNEPGSSFKSRTRLVELTQETLEISEIKSERIGITQALTQGIATIFQAKEILLVANGADKAHIIEEALNGPITEHVPASILQNHPKLNVFLDQEAAFRVRF
jgi:glucosamine-6-phosphate deaminase